MSLSSRDCCRLREAFQGVDYSYSAVVAALGDEAHRALARNHTVPAQVVLAGRTDPLGVLIQLWLLQAPVARADLEAALPGLVEPLLAGGVLASRREKCRARVDLRPYDAGEPLWVCTDLTPNLDSKVEPVPADFVLGLSAASTSLAQLTVRRPVATALDLGTGCGVQSVHLARHAQRVVATDLNPRALQLARVTALLNDLDVEFRLGDLYAPVAGERFDLITSNPPYVMSPPSATARLAYREGNLAGDGLVEHVVRQGAKHLADDGVLQVLANWVHPAGGDWQDRLGGWLVDTGCDAHVVQREVLDPAEYVEVWLADAGLAGAADYPTRYAEWLDYFRRLGIAAVGFGWLTLHASGRADPRVTIEDWPYGIEQPIAPAIDARLVAVELDRRLSDEAVLAARWVVGADVVEERIGPPGSADPATIVLRQSTGFGRRVSVDTALAGVVGACDGELSLAMILDAVARLLGETDADLRARLLPQIRQLALDGLILPAAR